MNQALLVIAKQPAPGQTKTRLSPSFSAPEAAAFYECVLRDMLNIARQVPNVTRYINYGPVEAATYFQQLAPDFKLIPQTGNSLGERLDNALTHCLNQGFDRVVITNSDSPTLPPDYIGQAFAELDNAEVVLGPCEDGGYYLIGSICFQSQLLREVKMSTDRVLKDTLTLAREAGIPTTLLPRWYDIDTIDDVRRLAVELEQAGQHIAPSTRQFLAQFLSQEASA